MTASSINNIVLIGYRAVGKTTLGNSLKQLIDWQYLSTDLEIERRVGEKISQFVAHAGWPRFREIEHQVIVDLGERSGLIIDCGGGVIESPKNMAILQNNALVVWVDAPIDVLKKRLRKDKSRPLLSQGDMERDIEINYQRRYPLYQQYANLRVDTMQQSKPQICRIVLDAAGLKPQG